MELCKYGCGQEGKYKIRRGGWCCSDHNTRCPMLRKKNSKKQKGQIRSVEERKKMSKGRKGKGKGKDHRLFGKKRSKETRKKIAANLKGRYKGKDSPNYGQIRSVEERKKISEKAKGNKRCLNRVLSIETRIKISCIRQGIELKDWLGFISNEPYCFDWKSKEMKEYFKDRDNYDKCPLPWCNGKNPYDLVRAHIDNNKQNCHPDNIIRICRGCNSAMQSKEYGEWWTSALQALMYRQGKLLKTG